MYVKQAVFLAGGKGMRLGILTRETPKPLLEVGGKPFLDYQIEHIQKMGISKVIIIVDYLGDQIVERYEKLEKEFNVQIECVRKVPNSETAAGLLSVESKLDDFFFTLNADSFFNFNINHLSELETPDNWIGRIALSRMPSGLNGGEVVLDEDGRVTNFRERGTKRSTLMNMGVYLFRRSVLEYIHGDSSSFERDVFPCMAEEGRLYGKSFHGYFIDIGTPERLEIARKEFTRNI